MQSVRDRLEAILSRLAGRASDETVYTRLYPEAARAAADAADARRKAGVSLGPLDGTIVSIKDLFDVAGEPTTAGSLLRRTTPPAMQDAAIVRRLRQAGAVIPGKTNMTEFAFTAVGFNMHYGTPGNAADASRIPAALNGVVGFKPTARRVPLAGAFPLSATLDSVGPLARSVADCAAADAVMAGDDHYAPSPRSLAGLRVAIPRGLLFDGTEPEVMAAFEHALAGMEGAGARLADITIDDLIAQMRAATKRGSIAAMEGAEVHADWLAEGAPVPVDPRVSEPLSRAATIPTPFYIRAMRRRVELARAMNGRFEAVDILALPASPVLAPTISALKADDALCDRVEGLMLRNTQVANQFDLCAISLPVPGTALPVGLMLVARHGHDRHLFDIAAGVEALLRR